MNTKAASLVTSGQAPLFHQHWWLSIVSGGAFREAIVERDNLVLARMPYFLRKRHLWAFNEMPPFTRTLGPIWASPNEQARSGSRQHGIVDELIGQLPAAHVFRQVFDPTISDALAFQMHDCKLGVQYTYHLDCRIERDRLWKGLRDKTRNVIRRAEERYSVGHPANSDQFVSFYLANLLDQGRVANEPLDIFPALYEACRTRDCGELVVAQDAQNAAVAMAFFAWDAETMYYLLSSRSPAADNGAVSLLLWHGLARAHARGLRFDFDGVSSPGRARFLSGFGGLLVQRLVIHKVEPFYGALRAFKTCLTGSRRANHFD